MCRREREKRWLQKQQALKLGEEEECVPQKPNKFSLKSEVKAQQTVRDFKI